MASAAVNEVVTYRFTGPADYRTASGSVASKIEVKYRAMAQGQSL